MNNEQIDNTSYYTLPSGRQLEDFIADHGLKFAEGSALKYLWRAGKKDGESAEKDRAKAEHFILFTAKESNVAPSTVKMYLEHLIKMAQNDLASDGFLPQSRVCKIIEHYEHAVKKHPYFADKFYIDDIIDPDECLRVVRSELRYNSSIGNVDTLDVLKCEIMEIMSAQKHGEVEHAKEECYDAIAVLLRMIDVLENRQPLGKPKEGAE